MIILSGILRLYSNKYFYIEKYCSSISVIVIGLGVIRSGYKPTLWEYLRKLLKVIKMTKD